MAQAEFSWWWRSTRGRYRSMDFLLRPWLRTSTFSPLPTCYWPKEVTWPSPISLGYEHTTSLWEALHIFMVKNMDVSFYYRTVWRTGNDISLVTTAGIRLLHIIENYRLHQQATWISHVWRRDVIHDTNYLKTQKLSELLGSEWSVTGLNTPCIPFLVC